MEDHKDEIRFVINFHSNGNSFIWPYNSKKVNDISKRNPQCLAVLQDVVNNAQFPPNVKTGNAFDAIKETVGGDADDWIMETYGIPSVTSEIGYENQFIEDWVVKSKEMALDIVKNNSIWLDYIFKKLPTYAMQLNK